jgi:putative ABC transport system permease protein
MFQRDRQEQEMRDEFDSNLQLHVEESIRAGMSPEQARREAILKFGSMEAAKESVRETARFVSVDALWHDLRYAFRGLRLNAGFATTAILSLTLGIGASVAVYTLADNLLLRPLPYPEAKRLVMLYETNPRRDVHFNTISPGNYFDWKAQSTTFSAIGGFFDLNVTLGDGTRTEEVDAQAVSGEVLPLLGVQPVRGRVFTMQEDKDDAHVAIISYRLWQSWFGGEDGIVGRQVQVNSRPFTIIGVLPPAFYFNRRATDVWVTLGLNPAADLRKTQGRWMFAVARLQPGVKLKQALTEMHGIARRLESAYPDFNHGWDVDVIPLRDSLIRQVKGSLYVLLGAVTLLLFVACANVANLLLARYNARRSEMAIRGALGAGRRRLLQQLLTESLLLGGCGGALGLALAWFAVSTLVTLAPKELTRSVEISLDMRVVALAFILGLLTSIIFGLAPALLASRANLNEGLHADNRASTGAGFGMRRWLVMVEIACSMALMAGAGLLLRTMIGLQAVNPGLDGHNVLTFRVNLPTQRYKEPQKSIEFFTAAQERLSQLPGVHSASAISFLPFNGLAAATDIRIQGHPQPKLDEVPVAVIRTVLPEYFKTMGIPVVRGRDFSVADDTVATPYRFIVNETFVRKYLKGEEPIGKQISASMDDKNPFGEIVGVVGDVKEGALDQPPDATIYYIHSHLSYGQMYFVLKTATDPLAQVEPARHVIRELDSQLPIAQPRDMESVLSQTFARQQFSAVLLAGFSVASLLLAAIGIYGVLTYSVTQRTREIGLRAALGADPKTIRQMIVWSGAKMLCAGALAGIVAALLLTGLMKSLLYGVTPHDPFTFIAAPALLAIVAVLAAYIPARRAARVSPMEALRAE